MVLRCELNVVFIESPPMRWHTAHHFISIVKVCRVCVCALPVAHSVAFYFHREGILWLYCVFAAQSGKYHYPPFQWQMRTAHMNSWPTFTAWHSATSSSVRENVKSWMNTNRLHSQWRRVPDDPHKYLIAIKSSLFFNVTVLKFSNY